jgi:hypothetical protein
MRERRAGGAAMATRKTTREAASEGAGKVEVEVDYAATVEDVASAGEEVTKSVAKFNESDASGDVLSAMLARDGLVFVSYVSDGFHEFALNWLKLLRKAKGAQPNEKDENIVMLALDEATERFCERHSMPCFGGANYRYKGGVMATGGTALGDASGARQAASVAEAAKAMREMTTLRVKLLLDLLDRGHDVLVSDADVAWLRDPREWMREAMTDVDVAASTDCLNARDDDEGKCWGAPTNTGILYFNATEPAKKFIADWVDGMEKATEDTTERDQEIFNKLLIKRSSTSESREIKRRVRVKRLEGGVQFALLPMRLFASGHTYFVQRLHERETRLDEQPLCAHATFQFSQVHGKRQRFREHGLWDVEEDDYYTQGNFIAMSDELPSVWNATGVHNHLLAAAWYRASIRNLLALGRVLNRTVILPRITCMCDRYWGHALPSCAIGYLHPPFVGCPQDHIMNLPAMEKGGANFREWSFLDNARTSDAIRNSVAEVSTVDKDSEAKYALGPFATDTQVLKSLGSARERVLVVDGALTSFCAFDSEASSPAAKSFDSDMNIALKAESWFCGPEDAKGVKCAIGFPVPKPTSELRGECARLRSVAKTFSSQPHSLLSNFFVNYGQDDKSNVFGIPKDSSSARQNASAFDIDLDDVDTHPFAVDE